MGAIIYNKSLGAWSSFPYSSTLYASDLATENLHINFPLIYNWKLYVSACVSVCVYVSMCVHEYVCRGKMGGGCEIDRKVLVNSWLPRSTTLGVFFF
jgi:hypothetical protein